MKTVHGFLLFLVIALSYSCKKFINKKSRSDLFVPSTLQDYLGMMDNHVDMNQHGGMSLLLADQFYLTDPFWKQLKAVDQNAHIWSRNFSYASHSIADFSVYYRQVFFSNVVLEGLRAIGENEGNKELLRQVEGMAHFHRAYAYYELAMLFTKSYDKSTASFDKGIPLRLHSDFGLPSVETSLQQTYQQILNDIQRSVPLLPVWIDKQHLHRPNRPATWALAARVHLSMRSYDSALVAADSCLRLSNTLLDYNDINSDTFTLSTNGNPEVLYQGWPVRATPIIVALSGSGAFIDSNFSRLYAPNDLRHDFYFKEKSPELSILKMTYNGIPVPFTGLATDEVYLIRAECYARLGNKGAALEDLNRLLQNRWRNGHFVAHRSTTAEEALQLILAERAKELVFRGQRWADIKRLNKDSPGITVTRLLNGVTHQLKPTDPEFVLPVPQN